MIEQLKSIVIVGLAALLIGGLGGWWLGSSHVKGQWARSENTALKLQTQKTADALEDFRKAQERIDAMTQDLTAKRNDNRQLQEQLNEYINRKPIVHTKIREVPANCPEVSCPVVDAGEHFRVWNAALRGESPEPDPAEADGSDGGMP